MAHGLICFNAMSSFSLFPSFLFVLLLVDHEKERKLFALVERIFTEKDNKTIIFAETKRKVEDVTRALRRHG